MGSGGSGLEIEVKIRAEGVEEAGARLSRLPATLEQHRRFEDNEVYDDHDGSLGRTDRLLRLRIVDGRGLVTYKERVESSLRAKVRAELQTEVASPDALRDIFHRIGLVRVYRYQKHRSDYGWVEPSSGVRLALTLDETPIGVFLELEGDKRAIDAAAERMGYSEDDYIVEDYRALHLEWLSRRGLPPADMVFG